MYTGIFHSHKLAVTLFLLIYVIKLILLLANKEKLEKFTKFTKIPEMIISFLFLATGIYLAINAAETSTLMIVKYIMVFASIPLAIIGFKKSQKLLASVAVIFVIGAYGLAEMNRGQMSKPVELSAEVITDKNSVSYDVMAHGKALYLSKCALCHGEDGKKGLSGAKDLSTSEQSTNEMLEIITIGKNSMPGYGGNYSKEEIEAIIQYVSTLKAG